MNELTEQKHENLNQQLLDSERVFQAQPVAERKCIVATKKTSNVCHINIIPDEILHDHELNSLIKAGLPKNYNFEIHKTIWRIKYNKSRRVLLQFPEGLIRFGPTIVDIICSYFNGIKDKHEVDCLTMGDLTYGACCIDDFLASSMNCDLIVHYAHSCLVPINNLKSDVKFLYVFVDIKFDIDHLVECIQHNFQPSEHQLAIASTIQFVTSVHDISRRLKSLGYQITLPQSRPLSAGEILGCTAPKLCNDITAIIFICDGRFHLEALMIANPKIPPYRYDPYSRKLTREHYKFDEMYQQRMSAIDQGIKAMENTGTFGIVLGTLGRQGSEKVFDILCDQLKAHTKCKIIRVLLPEVVQDTLQSFQGVDAWVQVACPRLSIDWGSFFQAPLLNTYEFSQCIKKFTQRETTALECNQENKQSECNLDSHYPMDFYAKSSSGPWTPNHTCQSNPNCACSDPNSAQ